jgi:heme/copper-type cytochrome/quinol oxidase subunit 3
MTTTSDVAEPRSATTGEPVSVVARRTRLGMWLIIVSDAAGVVALLIAYAYLWSLNVDDGWAPPNNSFADPLPFWLITAGAAVSVLLLWWGLRALREGDTSRMVLAAGLAALVMLVTFIGQIVQLSTFPFGPSDGAYASATFWLCIGSAFHLSLVLTLLIAVWGRTRAGLISPVNPSHAHAVAMYSTWAAIAILLGALFATTMTTSPNNSSPPMGDFQRPAAAAANGAASPSAAPSAAASSSAAPSPAASASASAGS